MHGTTTADNTMIEMSGAATGLLATEGHRDEIELRRDHKENIWDPAYPPPHPIARRRARIPIPERCDFEGNVVLALDEVAVRRGVQRLKKLGVESIAVCFLFSFVNSDHERRARELILEEFPDVRHISLSHEVLPRAPEFERTSTTLVNAYVAPKISAYVDRLVEQLRTSGFAGQIVLMQSSGGVMPPQSVNKRAVSLLGSGPDGWGDGGGHRRRSQRGARFRGRRHGWHVVRRLPGAGQPTGRGHRLELAPPLLREPAHGGHPLAWGPAAARSPGSARAPCWSGPTRPAHSPGRCVTAEAASWPP